MPIRFRHKVVASGAVIGLVGILAGCATTPELKNPHDPNACPAESTHIVVSVSQWTSIAEGAVGECGTVDTILTPDRGDADSFEPTDSDKKRMSAADIVVVNGLGYDDWAEKLADKEAGGARKISVEKVLKSKKGDNPYLWNTPAAPNDVAGEVGSVLREIRPDAGDYFKQQLAAWRPTLDPYHAQVGNISYNLTGEGYISPDGIFNNTANNAGLINWTPDSYAKALEEREAPSSDAVAEFKEQLTEGSAKVFIVKKDTADPTSQELTKDAEDAGLAVVEIAETPPDTHTSFADWQAPQVAKLNKALGGKAVPLPEPSSSGTSSESGKPGSESDTPQENSAATSAE